ncbi:class I SAM-dependent methyltransferase [Mycobacterium sp. IDR2000157661]|uniref:class I SAM-dependent methyltransferase n=1 Tax=Mycobacterium sp. IDR2000157661 TaxID=2867005 RepID=UPI001EEAF673|nr:class I SAM-dependent methyltransferase [Mycobacterium sp. IDR2000157661]ULE32014.1 class I SAM-dependent methyltransferase [Mycobacterium sp. IDR2000157661]
MTTLSENPVTTTETTEDFAGRIVGAIDSASVAILLSIGHQTKLFDTMAALPPASSAQIADAAGLNERYVREWLGGLAAGGIVDYDPAAQTYSLPQHRAAVLTHAAGPDNLARVAQFIPLLAEVEQKVIECFHRGGGLSYSEYPRFHTLMAQESGEVFDAALIDVILPMAEDLPDRLRAGVDVADIGCGSGHAINLMAAAFPASRFTGIDFSDEGLATGRDEAARLGLTNATFVAKDVAQLDATETYDVITAFDAIHDQAQPARVLENIQRALRPGGVFLMVDIKASSNVEDNVGVPFASYLYTVSTMHCMSVSLAFDGDGLGTCWGKQLATSMLADAGFADVQVREIDTDPINFYYVARKSGA